MALKLNATRDAYKEYSREASGHLRNVDQMPALIADGRVPMNYSQLMQRRLNVRNFDADVKASYMDNYFDTGDAVVYHPDGRVKIVLDSQTLRDITPQSELRNGALVLTEEDYNALQGEEFKKGKLGKIDDGMSRADVKSHPVLKVLARDQGLLNDSVDFIFGEYQSRFAKDKALDDLRLMGVYPSSAQGNTPDLRAWCVYRLGNGSDADGGNDLDIDIGRFVGIAPEALSAPGKGVSNIRTYTMADLQKFGQAVNKLKEVVNPKLLEEILVMQKKL